MLGYTIGLVKKTKKSPEDAEGVETTDIQDLILTIEGSVVRTAAAIASAVVTVVVARTLGSICVSLTKSLAK